MATLTETDVGKEVARANALYQPKDGTCAATPEMVRLLLDRLEEYTEEVRSQAEEHGLASDTNVLQWANDMNAWQVRLAAYQDQLDAVPEEHQDTEQGCNAIYTTVTAPLLDGIYYTEAPGIVLNAEELARIRAGSGHSPTDVTTPGHAGGHSNPKPPDVATPFSLGNQVIVYRDWQAERWRLFWDDLLESAKDVLGGLGTIFTPWKWPLWVKIGVGTLGVAAVGTGAYLAIRKIKRPKKNPGRRRRRKKNKTPAGTVRPHLEIVK